jgi:hypothetical protein
MAINDALRRFSRPKRAPKAAPRQEPIAVGEVEKHVFDCPGCGRPLANGAPVCPGCGTRLIFGVKAKMAMGFMVAGLLAGALLGGGVMYAARPDDAGGLAAVPDDGAANPGASNPANVAVASPTPTPRSPADVGIPSQAVGALRQTAKLDARLAAAAVELRAILKRSRSTGNDIAEVLRSLNADASFGVGLAPAVAPWTDAAKLSSDLGSFYRAVRDSSEASLQASVSDTKAYRAAGKRMVTLLAKLTALDATAAALVNAAGLAPLVPPNPSAPPASAAP